MSNRATNKPVLVKDDPLLKLLATVTIARGSSPVHLINYNPSIGSQADYAICYQCGFILRLFAAPSADRFAVEPTWQGRKQIEKLLQEHGKRPGRLPIPKEIRSQVRDQFCDGLIRQLRSISVGLRVDAWIISDFPELLEQQRQLIGRQLQDNLSVLGPGVRQLAPQKVCDSSAAMNAAFAAFWARQWHDPVLVTPYRAAGFLDRGESLLKLWDDIPTEPAEDRHLIDTWGQQLGLTGWYEFLPHRD